MRDVQSELVHATLSRMIENADPAIDWRAAATEVFGVKYQSWCAWISGRRNCHFPAEAVVPFCKLVKSFELLDELEKSIGRSAFAFPAATRPTDFTEFRSELRSILDDPSKAIDQNLLASRLGISYRQLRYFVSGDGERRFPLDLVVPFCQLLNDFRLLNHLEEQAGRIAFRLPANRRPGAADISDLHQLLEESMEAVKTASASMRDDFVDSSEASLIISDLDVILRHCIELRYWLDVTCITEGSHGRRGPLNRA